MIYWKQHRGCIGLWPFTRKARVREILSVQSNILVCYSWWFPKCLMLIWIQNFRQWCVSVSMRMSAQSGALMLFRSITPRLPHSRQQLFVLRWGRCALTKHFLMQWPSPLIEKEGRKKHIDSSVAGRTLATALITPPLSVIETGDRMHKSLLPGSVLRALCSYTDILYRTGGRFIMAEWMESREIDRGVGFLCRWLIVCWLLFSLSV